MPGGEGDSFELQGGGSSLEHAGFSRVFLGSPSIPPSFAERVWIGLGQSFPPGIPHPSPSPPGSPSGEKLGVGKPRRVLEKDEDVMLDLEEEETIVAKQKQL